MYFKGKEDNLSWPNRCIIPLSFQRDCGKSQDYLLGQWLFLPKLKSGIFRIPIYRTIATPNCPMSTNIFIPIPYFSLFEFY